MMLSLYLSFIMIDKYSRDVDELINLILDENPEVTNDDYWATFTNNGKSIKVWIANRWYSYAYQARLMTERATSKKIYKNKRPSRKTMARMHRYIRDNSNYTGSSHLRGGHDE